jgi:hypothetical protein
VQIFTVQNLGGFVKDQWFNAHPWLQHYSRDGFLPNGTYRVTVRYASGRMMRATDVLADDGKLIEAFRHQDLGLRLSGVHPLPSSDPLTLSWDPIEGVDGYYVARFWELDGAGRRKSPPIYGDSPLHPDRDGGPNDPHNKSAVKFVAALSEDKTYEAFVEVLDRRNLLDTHAVVFYPLRRVHPSAKSSDSTPASDA